MIHKYKLNTTLIRQQSAGIFKIVQIYTNPFNQRVYKIKYMGVEDGLTANFTIHQLKKSGYMIYEEYIDSLIEKLSHE